MLCFDSNYSNKGISKKALRIEHMLFYILAAAVLVYQHAWLLDMSVHTLHYLYLFLYSFFRATYFLEQIRFQEETVTFIFCKISTKNQPK